MRRRRRRKETLGVLIGGAAAGAGLMYLLDPERGRRRRALIRDQAVHLSRQSADAAAATGRDLANRSRSLLAEARARLRVGRDAAVGGLRGLEGTAPPRRWSPAVRLLAGAAGGLLALAGGRRRDPLGAALGAAGGGLLLSSLVNDPHLFAQRLRREIEPGGDGAEPAVERAPAGIEAVPGGAAILEPPLAP